MQDKKPEDQVKKDISKLGGFVFLTDTKSLEFTGSWKMPKIKNRNTWDFLNKFFKPNEVAATCFWNEDLQCL